jgi:PAS domain-containing protein
MSEPTAYDPGRPPWTSDPEALWAAVTNVIGPFEVYSTIRNDEGEIADFRVEYLNDEACSLSGLSRDQELGRPLKERFPNLHRGIFQAQVKVVETGEPAHLKNLVFRSDGERSHIELAVDIHLAKLGDGLAVRLERVTQAVRKSEAAERTATTTTTLFSRTQRWLSHCTRRRPD